MFDSKVFPCGLLSYNDMFISRIIPWSLLPEPAMVAIIEVFLLNISPTFYHLPGMVLQSYTGLCIEKGFQASIAKQKCAGTWKEKAACSLPHPKSIERLHLCWCPDRCGRRGGRDFEKGAREASLLLSLSPFVDALVVLFDFDACAFAGSAHTQLWKAFLKVQKSHADPFWEFEGFEGTYSKGPAWTKLLRQ